jgi:hypothetical protein
MHPAAMADSDDEQQQQQEQSSLIQEQQEQSSLTQEQQEQSSLIQERQQEQSSLIQQQQPRRDIVADDIDALEQLQVTCDVLHVTSNMQQITHCSLQAVQVATFRPASASRVRPVSAARRGGGGVAQVEADMAKVKFYTSPVTLHASNVAPHTSHLTPHTSHLTPHSSQFASAMLSNQPVLPVDPNAVPAPPPTHVPAALEGYVPFGAYFLPPVALQVGCDA